MDQCVCACACVRVCACGRRLSRQQPSVLVPLLKTSDERRGDKQSLLCPSFFPSLVAGRSPRGVCRSSGFSPSLPPSPPGAALMMDQCQRNDVLEQRHSSTPPSVLALPRLLSAGSGTFILVPFPALPATSQCSGTLHLR